MPVQGCTLPLTYTNFRCPLTTLAGAVHYFHAVFTFCTNRRHIYITNMPTHLSVCLRELHGARQKQPVYSAGLTELHLGAVTVTARDICTILCSVPTLRILRHYQLVTALNLLHGEQWRRNECLPKYRLRNLDVDFSHVVRLAFKLHAVSSQK